MARATPPSPKDIDLVDLARVAALGTPDDLRLLLNRLIGKYRTERPELSHQLDAILIAMRKKGGMGDVLRAAREDAYPNPTDRLSSG